MNKKIRLSDQILTAIITNFRKCFLLGDELWLFGSRVNPKIKGGDIDLYIETNIKDYNIAVDKKITFLSQLKKEIGDQKIDVVLRIISSEYILPIYKIAKSEGIKLI